MTSRILPQTPSSSAPATAQHEVQYRKLLEIDKTTIQLASFPFLLCPLLLVYQQPRNEYVVSRAEVLSTVNNQNEYACGQSTYSKSNLLLLC